MPDPPSLRSLAAAALGVIVADDVELDAQCTPVVKIMQDARVLMAEIRRKSAPCTPDAAFHAQLRREIRQMRHEIWKMPSGRYVVNLNAETALFFDVQANYVRWRERARAKGFRRRVMAVTPRGWKELDQTRVFHAEFSLGFGMDVDVRCTPMTSDFRFDQLTALRCAGFQSPAPT